MLTDLAPTRDQTPVTSQTDALTARIMLPCTLDALTQLSEWVHSVASENSLSARCTFRLELVLVEAVTNIVEHACAGPAGGAITVQLAIKPGWVVVCVEDSERPFDPTTAPAHRQPASLEDATIGGLGIHLMRAYTQQLEYRRVDDKNQLFMTLSRDD
jgi:anti-sigma regulatory factor (Ser/Thr protein kinase)